LRARETAELVVEGLGLPLKVEVREALTCGASARAYLQEIRAQGAGPLLLVAHNPEMSAFASGIVGQALSFRPATVCAVELEEESASLNWVRHP
jgi:phosphohistidine phosphatase SixA